MHNWPFNISDRYDILGYDSFKSLSEPIKKNDKIIICIACRFDFSFLEESKSLNLSLYQKEYS